MSDKDSRSLFYWHSEGFGQTQSGANLCLQVQSANLIDFFLVVAEQASEASFSAPEIRIDSGFVLDLPGNATQLPASLHRKGVVSILRTFPHFVVDMFRKNLAGQLGSSDISVSVGLSGTGTIVGLVRTLIFRRMHAFVVRGNRLETIRGSSRPRFNKMFAMYRVRCYDWIMRTLVKRKSAEIWFQGRMQHGKYVSQLPAHCENRLHVLDAVLRSLPSPPKTKKKTDLVFVGRITVEKGLVELLDALLTLKTKCNRVTLRIIGKGPDERELKKYAQSIGVEDQVVWCGFESDAEKIAVHLSESKAFVLPSYTEGLPRSLLEAMWCQVPCISTPVGGIPYVFEDSKSIHFVPVKDSKALADKIEKVLQNSSMGSQDIVVENARILAEQCSFSARAGVFLSQACKPDLNG